MNREQSPAPHAMDNPASFEALALYTLADSGKDLHNSNPRLTHYQNVVVEYLTNRDTLQQSAPKEALSEELAPSYRARHRADTPVDQTPYAPASQTRQGRHMRKPSASHIDLSRPIDSGILLRDSAIEVQHYQELGYTKDNRAELQRALTAEQTPMRKLARFALRVLGRRPSANKL